MELRKRANPQDSPLSSLEFRNSLGRKTVEHYNSNKDTRTPYRNLDDESSSESSPSTDTSQGGLSPKQMTSSPLNSSKNHLLSPHLSMISSEKPSPGEPHIPPKTRSEDRSKVDIQYQSETYSQENKTVNPKRNTSKESKKRSSFNEESVQKSLEIDFQDSQNTNWSYCFIFLLVIAVSGCWYFGVQDPKPGKSFGSSVSFDENLMRDKIRELKDKLFPSQNSDFWRILQSSFKRVFVRNLTMPACILLVTPDEQDLTANRLAVELSDLFLTSTNSPNEMIDPLEAFKLSQYDDNDAGRRLFDYLENSLKEKRIALVHDIGKLNGNVAMNLHPFCDEGSTVSSFPRSVVLFTIQNHLNENSKKKRSAEWVAEKLLNDAWEPAIGVDKAASLISRVAVSVLLVNPEETSH